MRCLVELKGLVALGVLSRLSTLIILIMLSTLIILIILSTLSIRGTVLAQSYIEDDIFPYRTIVLNLK